MTKRHPLARHYDCLTAEERFRLILAAGVRGDWAEQERFIRAGPRLAFWVPDHAPYAHAFHELAGLVYLELLEASAQYLEFLARADPAGDVVGVAAEEDGGAAEAEEGNGVEEAKAQAQGCAAAMEAERAEAVGEAYLDLALAAGFVLRTRAAGWQLFCERMTVPPFVLWEDLPGFDRLQRALKLSEQAAFLAEGLLRWLNRIRPAGEPEAAVVPLTAEGWADALEEVWGERMQSWGG